MCWAQQLHLLPLPSWACWEQQWGRGRSHHLQGQLQQEQQQSHQRLQQGRRLQRWLGQLAHWPLPLPPLLLAQPRMHLRLVWLLVL